MRATILHAVSRCVLLRVRLHVIALVDNWFPEPVNAVVVWFLIECVAHSVF